MTLSFFVQGTPVPQGSLSAFVSHTTKKIISPQKPKLVAWRKLIAAAAVSAIRNYRHEQLKVDGPKRVWLVFYLARPKKPKHERHVTKPDIDKLARSCLDAITGTLVLDDSQVAELYASKEYVGEICRDTGVWIKVESL